VPAAAPVSGAQPVAGGRPRVDEKTAPLAASPHPPRASEPLAAARVSVAAPTPAAADVAPEDVAPDEELPVAGRPRTTLARAPEETPPPSPAVVPPAPPALLSLARPGRELQPFVPTRLGGVFYLVNVIELLGLGEDVAPPLFDLVTLLGRALLDDVVEDPVWELLDELAGRPPDEPPGARFVPPREHRLPPVWCRPFRARDPWSFAATTERLVAEHPAGFCVLDVPRDDTAPAEQAARELAPYGVVALVAAEPTPTSDWLGRLAAYLRRRLALALSVPPAGAGAFLLRHRARVHVTATHLDIVFSLQELPLAIRLAGLDRDPGWVAAAGRFIAFHFE
jgi:hypothetical protein